MFIKFVKYPWKGLSLLTEECLICGVWMSGDFGVAKPFFELIVSLVSTDGYCRHSHHSLPIKYYLSNTSFSLPSIRLSLSLMTGYKQSGSFVTRLLIITTTDNEAKEEVQFLSMLTRATEVKWN